MFSMLSICNTHGMKERKAPARPLAGPAHAHRERNVPMTRAQHRPQNATRNRTLGIAAAVVFAVLVAAGLVFGSGFGASTTQVSVQPVQDQLVAPVEGSCPAGSLPASSISAGPD